MSLSGPIELQQSLDDYVNELNSTCLDVSAATAFARQGLDRLGFAGWTVKARSGFQTGGVCANGFPEPAAKTVILMPVGSPANSPRWPPRELATSLQPVTSQCLPLPAMESKVEQRASSLGISRTAAGEHNYRLNVIQDGAMRCTTLYETVGSTIDLVLQGPAAP